MAIVCCGRPMRVLALDRGAFDTKMTDSDGLCSHFVNYTNETMQCQLCHIAGVITTLFTISGLVMAFIFYKPGKQNDNTAAHAEMEMKKRST